MRSASSTLETDCSEEESDISASPPPRGIDARGRAVIGTVTVRRTEDEPLERAATETLMDAYVSGSMRAFDLLYQRVSPKLFGYLLRLTRNRERAEDLLQVTFGKVHRARGSYLTGAPFLPWALAIARRSFYDELRSLRARREELSRDGTLPEPDQETPAVSSDLSEALEQALDRLPESYREAIVLTKITGLSMEEAAQVLGTTPTATKLRVHRGYNVLRASLAKFGAEE